MWFVWVSIAMAGQPVFLGFSPSGRFAALAEVDDQGAHTTAELHSIDVDAGAWSHWPSSGQGADGPLAVAAAERAAGKPFLAQHLDPQLTGQALTFWLEGDHSATVWPRTLTARVRTSAGVGVLTLSETPTGTDCSGSFAVTPSWVWQGPTGRPVDLLRLRGPRRWPTCTTSFALTEVREGPGGALVFLIRATELVDGDIRMHTVLAATRLGGG